MTTKAREPADPVLNTGDWPPAKAARPAYTVCPHCALAREAAPPFEPPASRAAAGATHGRGRSPRTPAPVRSRLSGAPLWSPPTSRRRTRSPSARQRPSGSPTSGSGPTRLSAASRSSGSMPSVRMEDQTAAGAVTGRRLQLPARGRVRGLPAGITRAAGAGWKRPPTGSKTACISPDCGAVDPTFGGGSLPAPLSAQKRSLRFGSMRANRSGGNGFCERRLRERGSGSGSGRGC